jgi:hypothetical protein
MFDGVDVCCLSEYCSAGLNDEDVLDGTGRAGGKLVDRSEPVLFDGNL